ncbi:hypothetical protein GCM10023183_10580 [Nibribacter koreensis]|uniref:Uncharacterized protein n=2 Tax=Nibribacter koreensis TaxID=1084519 RepID=A0ABP8FCX9_9BACT
MASAHAQTDTSTVQLVSYWSKGDVYRFKVAKIQQQWRKGALVKNDSSQYTGKFEVLDSTETSYRIKWSYTTNVANTYEIPENLQERFSKYNLTEVIYTTSETGAFNGIENWQEIGKMMTGMFTDIIEVTSAQGKISNEELRKKMQPMINAYSSKAGIEQLVFKELYIIHNALGAEFETERAVEYDEEIDNMFGGKPIKAKGKLYFTHVSPDQNRCVMIQELKLDPADTKAMMSALFKKMGMSGKEYNAAMKTAKFNIVDLNRFDYNTELALPNFIETKRESLILIQEENVKRIDRMVIERVL